MNEVPKRTPRVRKEPDPTEREIGEGELGPEEESEGFLHNLTAKERLPEKLLPVYRQEEMFVYWMHKASYKYVAKMSGVNPRTVERYRKKNNWDHRMELIRLGAAEQTDELLAQVTAMMIREIGVLRKSAYLSAVKGTYDNARQAAQTYRELADLELRLRQPLRGVEGGLLSVIRERFQIRQGAELDKGKEIPAQSTTVPIKETQSEKDT